MPFDQRSLIHREAWFPPRFVRQNQQKKKLFLRGDFRPLPNKNVYMWDHFFPLLFPKDSESLKILDIRLCEVGAKRPLNGTSRSEHTHTQTHTQTDKSTYRKHRPKGPILWKSSQTDVFKEMWVPKAKGLKHLNTILKYLSWTHLYFINPRCFP